LFSLDMEFVILYTYINFGDKRYLLPYQGIKSLDS
jgi:hypothetical protein